MRKRREPLRPFPEELRTGGVALIPGHPHLLQLQATRASAAGAQRAHLEVGQVFKEGQWRRTPGEEGLGWREFVGIAIVLPYSRSRFLWIQLPEANCSPKMFSGKIPEINNHKF